MARKKRNELLQQPIQEPESEVLINGCFIKAYRWQKNDVQYTVWIKLSEIKSVMQSELLNPGNCMFYTYKDCCYVFPMDEQELLKLINDFVYRKQED